MKKSICERGKKCIFLEIKIEEHYYPIKPYSSIMRKVTNLNYYCKNPKKLRSYEGEKLLTHEDKFKQCSFKVTNELEEFISIAKS